MIRRFWPLALLLPLVVGGAAVALLGTDAVRPEAILGYRDALRGTVEAAPAASLAVFTLVYFAIISSALPVGPPMSLMAGFLFGRWVGSGAILLAATAGATVVFLAARASGNSAFGRRLKRKVGSGYEAAANELRGNAFGYLLVMRLVPFFPFFLVNVLAGLAAVPVRIFVLATAIGRLPAVFLYVSLGEELGRVSSLGDLRSGRIAGTLAALAGLALLPVLLARFRPKRDA